MCYCRPHFYVPAKTFTTSQHASRGLTLSWRFSLACNLLEQLCELLTHRGYWVLSFSPTIEAIIRTANTAALDVLIVSLTFNLGARQPVDRHNLCDNSGDGYSQTIVLIDTTCTGHHPVHVKKLYLLCRARAPIVTTVPCTCWGSRVAIRW